jgi:hypothetical protein
MLGPAPVEVERKPNPPPGMMAWFLTGFSFLLPVLSLFLGWIGIQDKGQNIVVVWFACSFASMIVSLVLSVVMHFWGLFKGFYPKPSGPWISICGFGMVSGIVTLIVGVVLLCRMNGVL